MARIAHLTDMHAGAEEAAAAEALMGAVAGMRPDLVVVGGDLTQRSRTAQWKKAIGWLDELSTPWIATPGNHDIPLFDVGRRAASPFGRFRAHVGPDLEPAARIEDAYVLCVRTATPKRRVEGAVERESLRLARELLDGRRDGEPVVLVTHHPLVMHPRSPLSKTLVIRGQEMLDVAAAGGVDLLLSGHTHRPYGGDAFAVEACGRRMVAMHGGTACSRRLRGGEPPSWQFVETLPGSMRLSSIAWDGREYAEAVTSEWTRSADGWQDPRG